MRLFRVARSIFLTAAAILGALCLVIFVVSVVFKITPAIVVSGSMEPTIPVGSMTFARSEPAADVSVGDVVTVTRANDNTLVTHRVVDKTTESDGVTELTLKGDANSSNDPLPYYVQTVGKVIVSVPYLGYVAEFFKTPFGYAAIALVVAALVLAFVVPVRPRRQVRRGDPIEAEARAIAAGQFATSPVPGEPGEGTEAAVHAEAPVQVDADEMTTPRRSRRARSDLDVDTNTAHPFAADDVAGPGPAEPGVVRPEPAKPEAARPDVAGPGPAGGAAPGPAEPERAAREEAEPDRLPSRRRARRSEPPPADEIDVDTRQGPFPPRRSTRHH